MEMHAKTTNDHGATSEARQKREDKLAGAAGFFALLVS